MHKTITLDQAKKQVETYLKQASASLPGDPTLIKDTPGAGTEDIPCTDENTGVALGTIFTQRSYKLGGLDSASTSSVFDALRGWLAKSGFQVVSDNQNQSSHKSVLTRNAAGYGVTIEHNGKGAYYLSAASPCVWRHGTPEPTSN